MPVPFRSSMAEEVGIDDVLETFWAEQRYLAAHLAVKSKDGALRGAAAAAARHLCLTGKANLPIPRPYLQTSRTWASSHQRGSGES